MSSGSAERPGPPPAAGHRRPAAVPGKAPGRPGAGAPLIHVVTLGCPKNTVDSERMIGLLQANGYAIAADPARADVVIVNTCGFIRAAKEESIEAVLAAHRLRRTGRCRVLIVTGCLATRYHTELQRELTEADQLLTIDQEAQIVGHVDRAVGATPRWQVAAAAPAALTPDHWAYLRISDGCDRACAFCTIPAIRGPHRSEPLERLVDQAGALGARGVRELVLVSQDSTSYGADLYGRERLVPLLEGLAAVEGIAWLRLMYSHPAFWTDELTEFLASCPKMCAYVDLPLQHVADPVLKRMRRATTRRQAEALLDRLRRRLPHIGLRSTFIVGFPGETEAQFQQLLDFVEAARFDHVTGFVFSPEEGTAACRLDGQVDAKVQEERYGRLTEVQERVSADINAGLEGTRHLALVDSVDAALGVSYARLERDAPEIDGVVVIESSQTSAGSFAEVEITAGYAYERYARLLSAPATGRGT